LNADNITKVESQRKRNKFIGYGRRVGGKKEVCLATMTIKFRVWKGVDRLAEGLYITADTDSSAVGEIQRRNWHKDD